MASGSVASCCLVLLVLCVAVNGQWWLLGVNDLSTIPIQDEPDIDCNSFSLTTHQKEYCQYAPELLNVIALGTRLGILECQSIFSVSRWNCTTFVGNDLFGSFVNTYTRESAFIQAMLSAGAARAIGQACKDEDKTLKNCTCRQEGLSGEDAEGNFIVYDCSTNPATGNQLMKKFLYPSGSKAEEGTLDEQIERHNNDFGIALTNNQYDDPEKPEKVKVCRCHGNSGSCALQTCYYESPSTNQIGTYLQTKFQIALKTVLDDDNELALDLASNTYHGDIGQELWYKSDSPDFCNADSTMGILGTKGRECDINVNSNNSCSSLCCGRGAQLVPICQPVETCTFVFCCEYICEETCEYVNKYYCK